jgi:hypothetical protein
MFDDPLGNKAMPNPSTVQVNPTSPATIAALNYALGGGFDMGDWSQQVELSIAFATPVMDGASLDFIVTTEPESDDDSSEPSQENLAVNNAPPSDDNSGAQPGTSTPTNAADNSSAQPGTSTQSTPAVDANATPAGSSSDFSFQYNEPPGVQGEAKPINGNYGEGMYVGPEIVVNGNTAPPTDNGDDSGDDTSTPAMGITITVIQESTVHLKFSNPWGKAQYVTYSGFVAGKKGSLYNTNVTVNPAGHVEGYDYSNGGLGIEWDKSGVALFNASFGNSTYQIGVGGQGFYWGSSMETNGNITGQMTIYGPTPLSGLGGVLEPIYINWQQLLKLVPAE